MHAAITPVDMLPEWDQNPAKTSVPGISARGLSDQACWDDDLMDVSADADDRNTSSTPGESGGSSVGRIGLGIR